MPREIEGHHLTDLGREGAFWATALEHLVAITPGSNYYHPHNGIFRLTFTLRRPALLEGLARLERAAGLEHFAAVGDGIEAEDEMKQVASVEEEPFIVDPAPRKTDVELQRPVSLDLSYSDVVTATEVLKGQPCAC
jgi:hypothetical protein